MIRWVGSIVSAVLIALVWAYRLTVRPLLPPACRYYPSCSEYFILAVRKYGPVRGGAKGVWRVCRCHPFNDGGYDPP
jgi:putative membrane protein insertion efficiency factor